MGHASGPRIPDQLPPRRWPACRYRHRRREDRRGRRRRSRVIEQRARIRIAGDLVLPGLVEGHMHLDKTLTGLPWDGARGGPDPDEPHRDRQDNPPAPADIDRRASWKPDPRMRRARHDASAHPCGHRSRKRPGQAGGRARRSRLRPGHGANRRFPPERCHALPGRSRPARCGGPQRRRSGRRHRSAGNRP